MLGVQNESTENAEPTLLGGGGAFQILAATARKARVPITDHLKGGATRVLVASDWNVRSQCLDMNKSNALEHYR